MKVAIGGSRRLPRGQAPRLLVRFLAAIPGDTLILLRHPLNPPDRPAREERTFEDEVAAVVEALRGTYEWCVPRPTDRAPGRASVFVRDIDMIERADLILLFFTPEDTEEGYSGTYHLLDKALAAGHPCYAYAVEDDGSVTRVGEYDPDHLYADIVPTP